MELSLSDVGDAFPRSGCVPRFTDAFRQCGRDPGCAGKTRPYGQNNQLHFPRSRLGKNASTGNSTLAKSSQGSSTLPASSVHSLSGTL